MLSTGLVFSLFIELVGFILWIKFVRDGQNKYKDITSAFMFLVALFILYQVFKLNLDFGLVLASATLFAAFAWILGKAINLEAVSYTHLTLPTILLV